MSIYYPSLAMFATVALASSGCTQSGLSTGTLDMASPPDLTLLFEPLDQGHPLPNCEGPSPDPSCMELLFSPLPLASDPMKDPNEQDSSVSRDGNGWIELDSAHSVFNYLWVASTSDLGNAGSVSKLDSRTIREVARYRTVTCNSLKTGSTAQCDGTSGCCSVDDWSRYQARKAHQQEPPHQAVQTSNDMPSRTSVDVNGDLFIANRALGGQSSVTKIANEVTRCVDRNHNGRLDTSRDSNGNGFIETDCNSDGQPDDLSGVKQKPCTNGLVQEFYGLDDECIVWTSNTFPSNANGRPLGLAQGANGAVSDPWAGSSSSGTFVRIDGSSGLDKDDVQLPRECYAGSGPSGLAVDSQAIAWAPEGGLGKLCYFDTSNHLNVGSVRDPPWGPMQGDVATIDRDQNVWVGSEVERYTPDRSNGFRNLNNGWWTRIIGTSGIGIAADSRNSLAYFVYSCTGGGSVLQIPASTIKVVKMDQQVAPAGWPTINMPCYAVGIDPDQNVWGVSMQLATRAIVDNKGTIQQPTVNGAAMGNNLCPKGDSCPVTGALPYSDFTGASLRSFFRPQGSYGMLVPGCRDARGEPAPTEWWQVSWDADVPANTSLRVRTRSGNSKDLGDASWGSFTYPVDASPLALQGSLFPNRAPGDGNGAVRDGWLFVELLFNTQSQNLSPRLKSFQVRYRCPGP